MLKHEEVDLMNERVDIQIFEECSGAHSHTYPQIMVPLQKNMNICISGKDYTVTAQELCLVPAAMTHECNFYGQLLVINLTTNMMDNQKLANLTVPLIVSMQGQILQLVDLIQAEIRQNPNSRALGHLYSYLYSKLLDNCAPPSIQYISQHYDLPITVNQLADIENYNVTYYNDWFKQQTGLSPSLYLRNIRIDKAKELLRTTEYGVVDIALMVGYGSNAAFTRAFRSITGMTPKDYRNCPCFRQTG